MESPAIGNPRWIPSPSPSRTLLVNDDEKSDQQLDTTRKNIPYSIIAPPPPPPLVTVDSEVFQRSPLEMEDHMALRLNDNGVYVTWKELSVTVPEKKAGGDRRPILEGVTGYVEPGEVLAVMGPSGCGKTTLLDALAANYQVKKRVEDGNLVAVSTTSSMPLSTGGDDGGRSLVVSLIDTKRGNKIVAFYLKNPYAKGRLDSNTRQTGDILINGHKQALAFGTSAYVTQDDTLMTTLTVKEVVYYSAQLQLPDLMSRSEKKERAEKVIREMGLLDAINTRIGGWGIKGLSGGQKRRVSICIEILTRPNLLFLDEPTSGLDSAASYHVMNHIIKLAQREKRTIIASIHQPSSEVFELFHNLCLLVSVELFILVRLAASMFFSINGFPCPAMRNPSDHFLRTVNTDFDSDIEAGVLGEHTSTLEAIKILIRSYMSSEACQKVEQRNGEALERNESRAGFITQCMVLTKRSFVNMYRDLGYYWLRLAVYIALCLCVGTMFYDVGLSYSSIRARGSMLMFVTAFLTFMAIGGFPSFVEDMKIFTRERLNGHYGVVAFVVGNTLSSIPYLVMISLIPGAMAYFLVGLQKGIDHFIYFSLLLFACLMLVESLMMIVASIVPDFLMGIIIGAGIQGVMMLNGGFFRLRDDLPKPFWRYPMYYMSFHKYANQGFYKNEFEGLSFRNEQVGGPPIITGNEVLRSVWQVEMGYSKWVNVGILFGMVILYRLMFLGIIKTTEKVKPMIQALIAKSSKM